MIKGDILYLTQASNKIHELINNIDKPMEQDALPKASAEIEVRASSTRNHTFRNSMRSDRCAASQRGIDRCEA